MSKYKTYAAYSNDYNVRNISSSGGIFFELAKHTISLNGIVYGVCFSDDLKTVLYKRVSSMDSIRPLLGSKYIQAKMGDTYKRVKEDLNDGNMVLFTGTCCQINGLYCFLQGNPENLYCVEVICHGTPSAFAWRKYLEEWEKKENSTVTNVEFRNKMNGWQNYGMLLEFKNKHNIFIKRQDNLYMKMFLRDYSLRPSCYNCIPKINKLSDMILGDFWGIDNCLPDMNDGKGVSLLVTRTHKGEQLFKAISDQIKYASVEYTLAVRNNPSEYSSSKRPKERDSFYLDLNRKQFTTTAKHYPKITLKLVKNKVIHILKR